MNALFLLNQIAVWTGVVLTVVSTIMAVYHFVLAINAINGNETEYHLGLAGRCVFDVVIYGAGAVALRFLYNVIHKTL